jgi:DNA-binding CsgD family transcriptional regulator
MPFQRKQSFIDRELRILRLHESGISCSALAERFGITRRAVANILWRARRDKSADQKSLQPLTQI